MEKIKLQFEDSDIKEIIYVFPFSLLDNRKTYWTIQQMEAEIFINIIDNQTGNFIIEG